MPLKEKLPGTETPLNESLNVVQAALSRLRYGHVAITVHEGHVVQIDVTEKLRLPPRGQ